MYIHPFDSTQPAKLPLLVHEAQLLEHLPWNTGCCGFNSHPRQPSETQCTHVYSSWFCQYHSKSGRNYIASSTVSLPLYKHTVAHKSCNRKCTCMSLDFTLNVRVKFKGLMLEYKMYVLWLRTSGVQRSHVAIQCAERGQPENKAR